MFQKLLKKVANELSKLKIPYMVIGGQAVLLYGEPRLTRDIDITVGITPESLETLKQVIKKCKLEIIVDDAEDFVKKTFVLPAMDNKSGIRVDFIFSFSNYEKEALERARIIKFGNVPIRFASLEDVVIHKIIAGRPRDFEDVKSILLKNPDYEKNYIYRWLQEFNHSLDENFFKILKEIEDRIK